MGSFLILDTLLKNGQVVDTAREIWGRADVGITNGRIAAVGGQLRVSQVKKVYDVTGKIVTPGLIDLHCHPVGDFAQLGVDAQRVGVNSGVTLLCDAGSAGAAVPDDQLPLLCGHSAGWLRR